MAARKLKAVPITEIELATYLERQARLKELAEVARRARADLDAQEADLIRRLQTGAQVEGRIKAAIDMVMPACRPSWKAEFEGMVKATGASVEAAIEKVIRATKAKLQPEPKLIVQR